MLRLFFSARPWIRISLGILYLLLIIFLSIYPFTDTPDIPFFDGQDKVIHFIMYAGLGFIACWSLDMRGKRMPSLLLLLSGIFLWGVLMEILQRLMALGRALEFTDMMANLAGAIAGLILYRFLIRLNPSYEFIDNRIIAAKKEESGQ